MTIGQFVISIAVLWVLACFTAITAYALWSRYGGRPNAARNRGVAEPSAPARFGGSSISETSAEGVFSSGAPEHRRGVGHTVGGPPSAGVSNFNLDSEPQVDLRHAERKFTP